MKKYELKGGQYKITRFDCLTMGDMEDTITNLLQEICFKMKFRKSKIVSEQNKFKRLLRIGNNLEKN